MAEVEGGATLHHVAIHYPTCVCQEQICPLLIFLPLLTTPPQHTHSALEKKRELTLAASTSILTPWHHQHPTNPAHKRKTRKRRPFGEKKMQCFSTQNFLSPTFMLDASSKETLFQSISYSCPAIFASSGAVTPNRISV